MHLKKDHMGNDQLLPAYNIQIGVADEYIAVADIKQYRSDMGGFVPLMEKFHSLSTPKVASLGVRGSLCLFFFALRFPLMSQGLRKNGCCFFTATRLSKSPRGEEARRTTRPVQFGRRSLQFCLAVPARQYAAKPEGLKWRVHGVKRSVQSEAAQALALVGAKIWKSPPALVYNALAVWFLSQVNYTTPNGEWSTAKISQS